MGALLGSTTYINHEKLGAFSINNSTYGITVPALCGTNRIASNIIDYYDFRTHEKREESGGKGGNKVVTTTYTYDVVVCLGLCEGPIKAVKQVWRAKDIVELAKLNLTLFNGIPGQEPWEYTKNFPDMQDHVLPYSGLAYLAGRYELGNSASLPQLGFEVAGLLTETGDGIDANPADIAKLILTDESNGIGLDESCIDTASLNNFRQYCRAADLLFSPTFTDQAKAVDTLKTIFEATNTIYFWSQNKLKFVPRCDSVVSGTRGTYTPDLTPLYDLDENDFIELDDGALITFERANRSETYNHQEVKFLNRANQYNEELAEFKIQTDINRRGLRSASQKDYSFICTKERAEYVAQILAQESLLGRTTYHFSLDWSFCLLEPGDIVTLSDEYLGLKKMLVRIETVEEQDDYTIKFTAKQITGSSTAAKYETISYERPSITTNESPDRTNAPLIYKLPERQALAIAVCGTGAQWGGCDVWVSLDGEIYTYLASIDSPSRYGRLLTDLSAGGDSVDVALYNADLKLLSLSDTAAQNNAAQVKIDDEWLSYQNAVLIAAGQYRLSGLRRGIFNTVAADHRQGSEFVRHDEYNYVYDYIKSYEGRLIHIILPAKNVFGNATQALEECQAYSFQIPVSTSASLATHTVRYTGESEWQVFSFNESFISVPEVFYVNCLTEGGIVYYQNLTASGFEAKVIKISDGSVMAASLSYTAQGVR